MAPGSIAMDEGRRLLRALARREKAAWAEVYDRHVRDVYGLVYHLVGQDRSLAEEIHQDVWLAALEGIDRYNAGRGRFRDWLMGIARHRVYHHFRGTAWNDASSLDGLALPESAWLPPPEQLEGIERADVVRAALIHLNPDQRDVLLEKYVEASSVAEIAERTGRTAKAVESLLSRARVRLRELLRGYFDHMEQGVRHESTDLRPHRRS
jgi:RNA polymerase sigma-70 factor, ECF subfamily